MMRLAIESRLEGWARKEESLERTVEIAPWMPIIDIGFNTAMAVVGGILEAPGVGMVAFDAAEVLEVLEVEAVEAGAPGLGLAGVEAIEAADAEILVARGPGGDYSVYHSIGPAGETQYAGMTNNVLRRAREHMRIKGFNIDELMNNLSRTDARAVEQALIETHGLGKNGGTLLNRINSISPNNPVYAQQLQRGYDLLQTIGYK